MNFIQECGVGPGAKIGTEQMIDAIRGSARVNINPLDHSDLGGSLLGHYRVGVSTGTTVSIGAAGILAYARWSDPNRYAVLLRVDAAVAVASAITAATVVDVGVYLSRGATASGSGGNAVTLTGNNGKLRSNMGSTLMSDMRVATTGALTRPTSAAADSNFIGATAFAIKVSPDIGATASATCAVGVASPVVNLYRWDALGQHPVVLTPGAGESVEVQEITAGPTTGGLKWYLTFEWAEVALF